MLCFPNDYKKGKSDVASKDISMNWITQRMNLDPFSFVFVAETIPSKKIIGFAIYLMIGGLSGVVELELIGVDEKYRKRGIGSQIIIKSEPIVARLLQLRFSKPLYKLLLTTSIENPSSHSFYKKHGYILTGNLGKLYWNTEEAVYTKEYHKANLTR